MGVAVTSAQLIAELRLLISRIPGLATPRARAKWLLDVAALRPHGVAALAPKPHVAEDLRALRDATGFAFPREVVKVRRNGKIVDVLVAAVHADARDKAPVLRLLVRMLQRRLTEWLAQLEAGGDEIPRVLALNSFVRYETGVRRTGKHGVAAAIDVGSLDFTSPNPVGVREVVELALTCGATELGLPFQGVLFPRAHACPAATAPDDRRLRHGLAAIYNTDCEKPTRERARTMLQDAQLRELLVDQYPGVIVYPDFDEHIHLVMV
jgi:hypothetical protein